MTSDEDVCLSIKDIFAIFSNFLILFMPTTKKNKEQKCVKGGRRRCRWKNILYALFSHCLQRARIFFILFYFIFLPFWQFRFVISFFKTHSEKIYMNANHLSFELFFPHHFFEITHCFQEHERARIRQKNVYKYNLHFIKLKCVCNINIQLLRVQYIDLYEELTLHVIRLESYDKNENTKS